MYDLWDKKNCLKASSVHILCIDIVEVLKSMELVDLIKLI
jgi:hypothetical protein